MSYAKHPRELVLLNEVTISAAGAQTWYGVRQPFGINPRFQLLVEDFTGIGNATISIEHSLINQDAGEVLYSGFGFNANGLYHVYTEELETRFPFAWIRANVLAIDSGVSFKATLAGMFDRSY